MFVCVCSEVNSGFFYKSAGEREKLVAAERKFVDDRVMQVIELKKKVAHACFMIHCHCIRCIISIRFATALVKDLWSSTKR